MRWYRASFYYFCGNSFILIDSKVKGIFYRSILLSFFSVASLCCGATESNIQTELSATRAGEGKVQVVQEACVTSLMNKKKSEWENKTQLTFNGYRVQVYMGNRQRTSKTEAESRENRIKAKFPEYNTYISFSSPFWKLRVGDFRYHADALVFAQKLKSAFFDMSEDIYVVRDSETLNAELENEEKNELHEK